MPARRIKAIYPADKGYVVKEATDDEIIDHSFSTLEAARDFIAGDDTPAPKPRKRASKT